MKSHWKSIRFFNSVETCAFTVEILFWTIAPVLFEVTFPRGGLCAFFGIDANEAPGITIVRDWMKNYKEWLGNLKG